MPDMKAIGPDHPITVDAHPQRVLVKYRGHVIADSHGALALKEASYKPVLYFPRQDVAMDYLHRTDHHTFCPYKGQASYYSLVMDGDIAENAVWTYEAPFAQMSAIDEYVAFYPNQVEMVELEHPRSTIDQAILHTDSGSGSSQREHWKPTVENPEDGPLAL